MSRNDEMTERRVMDRRAVSVDRNAAHVGDSEFESWFSEKEMAGLGTKQLCRDAYAAGMSALAAAPASPAAPTVPTSFDDYWWEARHDNLSAKEIARSAWDFASKQAAPQPLAASAVPATSSPILTAEQIEAVMKERDRSSNNRVWLCRLIEKEVLRSLPASAAAAGQRAAFETAMVGPNSCMHVFSFAEAQAVDKGFYGRTYLEGATELCWMAWRKALAASPTPAATMLDGQAESSKRMSVDKSRMRLCATCVHETLAGDAFPCNCCWNPVGDMYRRKPAAPAQQPASSEVPS